eukprot:RCo036087
MSSTVAAQGTVSAVDPALSVVNLNGILCEVLQYPPESVLRSWMRRDFDTVFVFIPGNPGIIEFYSEFLATLQGSLGPGVACVGLGLAGHSIRDLGLGRPPFNLAQQLAH